VPPLCAGITTFNALRQSGAMPGDLVAVEGIGGLGHLGVQFASKFVIVLWPSVAEKKRKRWRFGGR
jgi:D-arabinose 1-dehydrogenase-like Zn-dependent alcohol dehydrogenase